MKYLLVLIVAMLAPPEVSWSQISSVICHNSDYERHYIHGDHESTVCFWNEQQVMMVFSQNGDSEAKCVSYSKDDHNYCSNYLMY
jgi:hypothetical protein